MAEFTINISEIDEVGKGFSWPVSAAWVKHQLASADLRSDKTADVGRLEVFAQGTGDGFFLQGHVALSLLARCVRCLEDAPVCVRADLVGLLRRESNRLPDEDAADEDMDPRLLIGDEILLDEWVREHIVVECPMRPLCGDDCNGLEVPAHIRPPDDFGDAPKGVDPRLLPLLELKDKVLPNKE